MKLDRVLKSALTATVLAACVVTPTTVALSSVSAAAAPSAASTATLATYTVTARSMYVDADSPYSNIKALQHLLSAYGFATTPDGSFGPATRASVSNFQAAKGLSVDGDAGPLTMAKMLNSTSVAASRGWTNSNTVLAVQQLLKKVGYAVAVDGSFGPATESAVISFQNKYGIQPTGVVNYVTWSYLVNTPLPAGTNLRTGPVVEVAQYTSLSSWAADCGPSSFVSMLLRLGKTPGGWTDVAHRADAIRYARYTSLLMSDPTRGTSQIGGAVGVRDGFRRTGLPTAQAGYLADATLALRSGGVALLGGELDVAAAWNGRTTHSSGNGHWIALLDYNASTGKYLAMDPSGTNNVPVWVTQSQLATFEAGWPGDLSSVYVK